MAQTAHICFGAPELGPGVYIVEYIPGYEERGFRPVCVMSGNRIHLKKEAQEMVDTLNKDTKYKPYAVCIIGGL